MKKYNRKYLFLGITVIGLFIFGILGLTYAFFIAGVVGNPTATPTVVETADLRLVFTDTQVITMNDVLPGASQTKTFTVENIGNRTINYDINIIDVINTFTNDDLIYSLTSTNGGATITNTSLPTINGTLVSGTIGSGITQIYTITILFKETGINQNTNQGAAFTGKLQINASGLISDEVTFSIAETTGTIAPNQTMKVNLLGNYYGKVSCTSENTNIAECTSTQNEINILGKNIGTTNITVTENNKNLETTYTVTVVIPTVYNKMLADNTSQSDSTINFTQPSSETNGRGLYYTEDNATYGEDGQRIYYFRGAVNNNWVSFGGYLWRIVRTTSEGGVKLAYSGNASGISSAFINTSTKFINSLWNNKYLGGYTYNTGGYTGTQTDSIIKGVIDTWYNTNLNSYASYLSDIAVYCADRSSERTNGGYLYFAAYDRLVTNKRPTFICPFTNQSRYAISIETGNGYLQKPIALLNADEINYAGLVSGISSLDSYIMANATGTGYWLISPFYFVSMNVYNFNVNSLGNLNALKADATSGVRPTISLKSCITVSEGNGTQSTPYILSNSNCI